MHVHSFTSFVGAHSDFQGRKTVPSRSHVFHETDGRFICMFAHWSS